VLYHGTYALIAVVSYHSHTTYVVAQYMRMSFRWCVAHAIVPCAATGQIRLSFAVRRPCCGGWLRSRLDIDWYSSGVFCGLTATYTCSRQNVNCLQVDASWPFVARLTLQLLPEQRQALVPASGVLSPYLPKASSAVAGTAARLDHYAGSAATVNLAALKIRTFYHCLRLFCESVNQCYIATISLKAMHCMPVGPQKCSITS
jgi:hypothetical protein